jgi:hypothetical protein
MINKNNHICGNINEYTRALYLKCQEIINGSKKQITKANKVIDNNFIIPTFSSINLLLENNYNLNQLKEMTKHYKLKNSGNKNELLVRIYIHIYYSHYAIKIQKIARKNIVKRYILLHGPASFKRDKCINQTDFISMEPINEINYHTFISYEHTDASGIKRIYGFDIASLHNMFVRGHNIKNPYNREKFPDYLMVNVKTIIYLSKLLHIPINLKFENENVVITSEKSLELRVLGLFQIIDSLGNYTNPQWFNTLNSLQIKKFIKELMDIWNYRAEIPSLIKRNICPPNGTPFINISFNILNTEVPLQSIKNLAVEILEKFLSSPDTENKKLGAYYILCALTLVNAEAASTMPWLYEASHY